MFRLTKLFAQKVHINTTANVRTYFGAKALASALPSNLQLADHAILEELPEPTFPALNYSFATLDVPSSITVKQFLSPDATQLESVNLERKIFEVAIRKDIVHNVIRYIRHKKRQPKKTKRLNEISGSKKKPRPQKGTGTAQVGNKRNSVWRKGQKAFGPVLRDYSIELNRKVRALGMMMTLSAKFREGNLVIFDTLNCPSPRTKDLNNLLQQHGLAESTMLFVEQDECLDENFLLASRNLRDVLVRQRRHIDVYEILKKDKLVLTRAVFEDIQQRLLYQYTYGGKRRNLKYAQAILDESKEIMEQKRKAAAATTTA